MSLQSKAMKMCKWWQTVNMVIMIIISIIGIVYLYEDNIHHSQAEATVLSIEGTECEKKERVQNVQRTSYDETYYDCQMKVSYMVDGNKFTNALHTFDHDHTVGETITIDYSTDNINVIRNHKVIRKFGFYFLIVLLCWCLFLLYLYIYKPTNEYVSLMMAYGCLRSLLR